MTEPVAPTRDESSVYVVAPDPTVVATLKELFACVRIKAEYFDAARDCLKRLNRYSRGCVIADTAAPDVCGADFQQRLRDESIELPVIFLSYSGDVTTAVMALKNGAADFFEKPFNSQTLLDAVHRAIETDRIETHDKTVRWELRGRFDTLTPREWDVVVPMIKGCSNRMIATQLELSEKTVELYRSRIMRKIGVAKLTELIRIAIRIDLLTELAPDALDPLRMPPLPRPSPTRRR